MRPPCRARLSSGTGERPMTYPPAAFPRRLPPLLGLAIAGSFGLLSLSGCGEPASAEASAPTKPTITVVNHTRGDLEGIVVKASMPVAFSELARGKQHTLGHRELELTEKVKVRWIDARGKAWHKTLHPHRRLGKHYRGPIEITLKPGGSAELKKAN